MGVDWYTCKNCDNTFHDAGNYGCCSKCEEMYCGKCYDAFIKKYGEIDEDNEEYAIYGESLPECDWCNGKKVEDSDLLNFALEKLCMKRSKLKKEYVLHKFGR
ncbi:MULTISPECIES: hypothetical protein [unclassified Paenibacillus]|uniref:hypothetical protein n=1 Tax=Paenibacillus sp. HGF7 TaxID=944559 RepID=UPI00034E8884|nr:MULTISPECIES: hypothetical protein [unclassified Paenibacillus]EPD81334.1 hypothetical protein HMPREF1207_05092 [Paenibacillus sp. HGH0039]